MKKPKMIGAHPRRPAISRARRDRLFEAAAMVNAAFDQWAKRQDRSHLAYCPTIASPRR